MARILNLSGPVSLNPSDRGVVKKWKFKNETGEPIFDFIFPLLRNLKRPRRRWP